MGPTGPETSVRTRMFNANESDTARKYRTFFKRQSRDYQGNNDRALYQVTVEEDGAEVLRVPAEKKAKIKSAWGRIEKIEKLGAVEALPRDAVDALGELIWEMGMQYGPTLQDTQSALHRYFSVGDSTGTKGIMLFNKFVKASDKASKSTRG